MILLRFLNMLLSGPSRIYIAQSPWHFEGFRKIFLRNIGEGQKKSHNLSSVPLALCHMVSPPLVTALRS